MIEKKVSAVEEDVDELKKKIEDLREDIENFKEEYDKLESERGKWKAEKHLVFALCLNVYKMFVKRLIAAIGAFGAEAEKAKNFYRTCKRQKTVFIV